jgi:alpha-N-acetylglucosaminidase
MGNINAWAGPLTPSWHQQQLALQKKILTRERSFGMKPVLPGFAGHVPPAMSKIYPKANIVQLQSWCLQDGTYYLDPTDQLFSRISTLFIQRQAELFGTDHLYNFDPFNELYPPSNSTTYLSNCAKNMFQAMISADPQGIWVIQGWFLYNHASFWQEPQAKAFFGGVPIGKMLVLDLWSEEHPVWTRTQSFYGHEWIWCMLHNFGGRSGMYGDLPSISTGPVQARKSANNMVGTGITMEALLTNVVVYDMMNEMSWRTVGVNIPDWLAAYVFRRYGDFIERPSLELLQMAWGILSQTVYSCNTHQGGTSNSLIAMRPTLQPPSTTVLYYPPSSLIPALQSFVQAARGFANVNSTTFQYDFADLTRQCMSNLFLQTHASMVAAYNTSNYDAFAKSKGLMLSIIADMETLLASQPQNLLGTWTAFARGWATNSAEAALLEWNARTQVTLWAQNSVDSQLHDYAYKLWSGLVGDFYYPRWSLFLERLDESMQFGTAFDYDAFLSDVVQLEYAWTLQNKNYYPQTPSGDTVLIAQKLWNKYSKFYQGESA